MRKLIVDLFLFLLPNGKFFIEQNEYKNSLSVEEQQVIGCYSEVSTGLIIPGCHKIGINGLLSFHGILNKIQNGIKKKNLVFSAEIIEFIKEEMEWIYTEKLSVIETYYKNLYKLIRNAPVNKKPFYTFRGLKKNTLIDMETFISTSFDIILAEKFSIDTSEDFSKNQPMTLIIKIPENSHVMSLGYLSKYLQEYEIVIPPCYKIVEKSRRIVKGTIYHELNAQMISKNQLIIMAEIEMRPNYKFELNLKKMYPTFESFINKYNMRDIIHMVYYQSYLSKGYTQKISAEFAEKNTGLLQDKDIQDDLQKLGINYTF